MRYSLTFCGRPEAAVDVITGVAAHEVGMDVHVKFGDYVSIVLELYELSLCGGRTTNKRHPTEVVCKGGDAADPLCRNPHTRKSATPGGVQYTKWSGTAV